MSRHVVSLSVTISFSFLVLLAAASGCSSTGNRLDATAVNKLQKGVTTRAQVESAFGAPISTSILPDGRRSVMYFHYESHGDTLLYVPYVNYVAGGIKNKKQSLQIIYKDNIVDDYEFSQSSEHTAGGMLNQHGTEVPISN